MIQQSDTLEQLLSDVSEHASAPLWTQMSAMVPPRPQPKARPHLWRWSEMRPLLGRAGRLVSEAEAERRVLMLVNPALRPPYTTDTLFSGFQLINPGETAPAHRHVAFALRFIVEGERGFTAVGGEKMTMRRGDVILTPSWTWHDHGHEGDGPMIWLDGLDLPLFQAIPTNFAEPYYEARYPSQPASADNGMSFPWQVMRARLDAVPGAFASARYETPAGLPVSRTIGAGAERLAGGSRAPARRATTSAVYHVYEGSGTTRIGDETFAWEGGDTFAVPAWTRFEHEAGAGETAYLFRFDDRPLLDALGHFREEPA